MTWRKRIFDLFFASLLVVLLGPLLLGLLIWLLWQEGRPLFYVAERMKGVDRPFMLWKLRTMRVVEADTGVSGGDKVARITRTGAWLRSKRLDELPQLWNILRGDLSFVGPRPIVTKELAKYGSSVSAYLAQKPGITGLWQVSGRNDISYDERVALDVTYLARRSFLQDLKIILRTGTAVLGRTGR